MQTLSEEEYLRKPKVMKEHTHKKTQEEFLSLLHLSLQQTLHAAQLRARWPSNLTRRVIYLRFYYPIHNVQLSTRNYDVW